MTWLYSISDSIDMDLSKLQETMKDREAWHAAVHRVTMSQTQVNNRTTRSLETILLLPFDLYAFFFSYPIAMVRTLITTLNKNDESAHYHFVSDLREKVFSFSQVCCYLWVYHTWPLLY